MMIPCNCLNLQGIAWRRICNPHLKKLNQSSQKFVHTIKSINYLRKEAIRIHSKNAHFYYCVSPLYWKMQRSYVGYRKKVNFLFTPHAHCLTMFELQKHDIVVARSIPQWYAGLWWLHISQHIDASINSVLKLGNMMGVIISQWIQAA